MAGRGGPHGGEQRKETPGGRGGAGEGGGGGANGRDAAASRNRRGRARRPGGEKLGVRGRDGPASAGGRALETASLAWCFPGDGTPALPGFGGGRPAAARSERRVRGLCSHGSRPPPGLAQGHGSPG